LPGSNLIVFDVGNMEEYAMLDVSRLA